MNVDIKEIFYNTMFLYDVVNSQMTFEQKVDLFVAGHRKTEIPVITSRHSSVNDVWPG